MSDKLIDKINNLKLIKKEGLNYYTICKELINEPDVDIVNIERINDKTHINPVDDNLQRYIINDYADVIRLVDEADRLFVESNILKLFKR